MTDKAKAEGSVAKMQPYFSQIGDSDQEEVKKMWATYGGMGELKLSVDAEGFVRIGTMLVFSEKLIIDTLKLESLQDLDGYREIWILMEDLDQKMTAEVEFVTTPFRLLGEGQDNGVMGEVAQGMGAGMVVYHLKKLDYIIDKAKSKASATGVLNEFERVMGSMTANLNIIRPGLLLGIMSRNDFYMRDWESILNPEESKGQENFIKIAKMSMWHMLTQEEAWSPLNDPNWVMCKCTVEDQVAKVKTSVGFDLDGDSPASPEDKKKMFDMMDGMVELYRNCADDF